MSWCHLSRKVHYIYRNPRIWSFICSFAHFPVNLIIPVDSQIPTSMEFSNTTGKSVIGFSMVILTFPMFYHISYYLCINFHFQKNNEIRSKHLTLTKFQSYNFIYPFILSSCQVNIFQFKRFQNKFQVSDQNPKSQCFINMGFPDTCG